MEPLRIGVAGTGAMGKNHLRVIGTGTDARVVAVSDPIPATLEAAAARTGATPYADAIRMLDEARLDGLIIATPTTSHAAVALAAIDRDIPVLVEKPLAATVDEGLEIVARARGRNVLVQVGHIERFNPAVRELDRLLADGWLDKVYSISSRRAGPFPARIRDVGVTVDLATHDVDILSWIAGERPQRVFAETARRIHAQHEDLLFGLLHFGSGAKGFLDVNWLSATKRRQLHVVGEQGMFDLDYLSQKLTFTRHENPERPALIRGYAPTFSGDVIDLPVTTAEPLAAELGSFFHCVRTGEQPVVTAEDGLWAVAMANALLESAARQQPVELRSLAARLQPA